MTKGNTLKQGDLTVLKHRLFDADGDKLDISGKPATVRLMKNDFTFIAYEKEGLTVAPDDTISFNINKILPGGLYHLEIIVDDKYIFPSRADEGKFNVDKSSLGAELTIIENTGIDAVVRKAVDLINEDPSLIIDEDKLISEIIANTSVGSIEEYYQEYRDAIKEYADLKPKALSAITKSAEALSKSQNALNVANGIDAKATNALSLSESANILSKSVQEQFNQVVIDGDSSVEAAQARVDASGQTNPSLKARLDKEHNEVTTQLAQTAKINAQVDFVDLIKNNTKPYALMQLLKVRENGYQVWLANNNSGIIYDFTKDANDDFIKLNAGYSGLDQQGYQFVEKRVLGEDDLIGTFTVSGASCYTTTVGDSFTLKVKGERLTLVINTETRGGVWSIQIDGKPPIMVSCYNPTTEPKNVVIAENLDNIEHTIVGTFVGDDPLNPPSSSPSRGYLRLIDTAESGTLTGHKKVVKNLTTNTLLATASNKEFAFTASKNGTHNWIPEHDAKGSAFNITPPEFYLDGNLVDANGMTIGSNSAIVVEQEFELKQHFYGRVVGQGDVMKIWTSHKIDKDGKLTFQGRLEAVESFNMMAAYPMMLPAQNEFMDEFVSGIFNSKVNSGSENYDYFDTERDMVTSGAIISSVNKNLISAGTLYNPIKTYRLGRDGKPPLTESLFVWNRAAKPKMYWMSMQNNQFNIGDTYSWGFDLVIAEIDGIYDLIKD